jgi:ATP-dependent helicase/nuclease subunit B
MTEPNLFALPPGVDFPAELVEGLLARMTGKPPEALARVTLIVNTQRMRRRVTECLQAKGALLLPRLMLVTEAAALAGAALPRPISPLRRRLELSVLLDGLLATGSTQFPRTALYDLADSLAALMEEMQGEGVDPGRIARLDVANHSAHWARTQAFLGIVTEALCGEAPDAEAVLRRAVTRLTEQWAVSPPADPVILAGSTASRGTTALLVQAIARLPNGAVVLPGYDFDTPDPVWDSMEDALTAEDHPQYRFRRVMDLLDCGPGAIRRWTDSQPPDPGRNRLISLSLRPAPITDQWLTEGPKLPDLPPATEALTLIEAPGERAEAIAIALILREAAETGTRAALISPDRNLTRRVTAALDRWGIRPDDSAGRPLALSAPGRLMRQVAALFGQKLTGDALLALLKHPLAFSGPGFGARPASDPDPRVRAAPAPSRTCLPDGGKRAGLGRNPDPRPRRRLGADRGGHALRARGHPAPLAGRVRRDASGADRGSGAGLCRDRHRGAVGQGGGGRGAEGADRVAGRSRGRGRDVASRLRRRLPGRAEPA